MFLKEEILSLVLDGDNDIGNDGKDDAAAFDLDNDPVGWSLLDAPAGMSIDAGGRVQWTPTSTPDQPGPHIVEVAVTDPQGGRGVQRYAILARVNQPPQITSLPVESVSAGAVYRYDVQVDEPDGDEVTFSLNTAPAGLTIDEFGRLMWSTPGIRKLSSLSYLGREFISENGLGGFHGFEISKPAALPTSSDSKRWEPKNSIKGGSGGTVPQWIPVQMHAARPLLGVCLGHELLCHTTNDVTR